jgi:3-dehydroquinate dehydratase/shikimate dehydrogenase
LPAEHDAIEAVVVLEAAEHGQAQALLVEAQQGFKIVARAGDAKYGNGSHAGDGISRFASAAKSVPARKAQLETRRHRRSSALQFCVRMLIAWDFVCGRMRLLRKARQFDRICGVAAAETAGELEAQLHEALRLTRTVELRLDWLRSDAERRRFFKWLKRRRFSAELIATCRRREAGGRFTGDVAAERQMLSAATDAGCRWYDLEVESIEAAGGFEPIAPGRARAIVSLHRFDRPVRDPHRLLSRFPSVPGVVWKLAVECRGLGDAVRLIRLARKPGPAAGMIVVPMGRAALPARLLALREGSLLTYAAVSEATAPGQPTLETAIREYRAERIDRRTRAYGIIGNKTGRSTSPAMHNAAFAAAEINAIYLPFHVEKLGDFLGAIRSLGIGGFSVTIPHKRAILRHLDACHSLAKRLGAVNTVVVRRGRLYGYNTDYAGVVAAIEGRVRLAGCRALLVGAGGAARAAAFALADSGARVFVVARRPQRARELARACGGKELAQREIRRRSFDLIVNATPVGMAPDRGTPLSADELNAPVVFDMVYRPIDTPLLRLAARRGLETISGVEMLVAQGVEQWELWTGRPAPARVMRRAALEALGRSEG